VAEKLCAVCKGEGCAECSWDPHDEHCHFCHVKLLGDSVMLAYVAKQEVPICFACNRKMESVGVMSTIRIEERSPSVVHQRVAVVHDVLVTAPVDALAYKYELPRGRWVYSQDELASLIAADPSLVALTHELS